MNVKAKLKNIRISSRKIRLIANLIRNKKVGDAISILNNTNKKSSIPVQKLVKSAVANAVNNNGLDADLLFIKEILVNEGSTLKRFNPRAHGRAYEILKRTSHITIAVSDEHH